MHMAQKLLLIDFENVQQVDLACLDESSEVVIFVGASQKSIPIELVVNAQKLGSRIQWQRVDANGSNALDFFSACHLGRVLERSPQTQCLVLTKDQHISSIFQKKLPQADIDHIIDVLFAKKLISETNGAITYEF